MKELYRKILKEVETEYVHTGDRNRDDNILIIDGLNTFIRSWTTNPTMNENGDHVGGIMGFMKSIGFAIRTHKPTRVFIVFDGKGGSDRRKELFEGYKSDRGKNRFRVNRTYPEMMNEEEEHVSMRRQFMWLVDYLNELPLTTLVYDGVEADDVIAFISNHFNSNGSKTVIMSTDKDFLQLVDERTKVYSPTKKLVYDTDLIQKEFGLFHKNFLLYRVLDGDTSDSIPGVKGCGLKTLLKRFPELSDTPIGVDDLIRLCGERVGKAKVYSDILQSEEQIKLNVNLMGLFDPKIGALQKTQILGKIRENNKPLDKMEFIKVGLKHKMGQNWGDLHDWLKTTFGGLVNE